MRPAGLAAFEKRTDDRTGVYSFERENAALPPEYEDAAARESGRRGVLRLPAPVVPAHRHPPDHERQA